MNNHRSNEGIVGERADEKRNSGKRTVYEGRKERIADKGKIPKKKR